MTIKHGFFASADPDNPTTYDQQTYAKRRLMEQTDGILEAVLSELRVTPTDPVAMRVDVTAGSINIQGYWMDSDEIETLQLAAADVNNPRIDRIVARLDTSVNLEISLVVLTGTPASSPAAPALTRSAYIYEMSLAQVYVGAGVTSVSLSNITDERRNASYCGYTRARYGGLPPGSITSYAGATVPSGWLLCDGATLNKADYPELFSAIGYIYGGTGESFKLPDARGRFPLGTSDSHELGGTGGAETVELTEAQIPAHGHSVTVGQGGGHAHIITAYADQNNSGISGFLLTGAKNYPWRGGSYSNGYYNVYATQTGSVSTSSSDVHSHSGTAESVGSDEAHPNMPPYLSLNFIIKT